MSLSSGSMEEGNFLSNLGYPVYKRLFDDDSDFVTSIGRKLAQARIPDPVEMYLSRALSIGLLTGVTLWIIGSLVGWALFAFGIIPETLLGLPVYDPTLVSILETIKVPLVIFLTGIVLGSIGFLLGFGSMLLGPYTKAGSRGREINFLLPDAVAFMYALSVGGMNQLEIIQAMARADDTYGEVAREFKTIMQETEYFDVDYRTAIQRQALETPSEELSQFLTDMLSILNSGGDMTSFLDDKKDKHLRTAKQEQEAVLETLELFGEMFMTLSLFPLFLIIILVIMSMMPQGGSKDTILLGTIYGLIPGIGVGFLLLIATVKQDDPGDGFLQLTGSQRMANGRDDGLVSLGLVDNYVGQWPVFSKIRRREGSHRLSEILGAPHLFLRDHPLYTLAITIPITIIALVGAFTLGLVPTSFDDMIASPVGSTFVVVYLPLYITMIPLAIFYEWNRISRLGITGTLSDNLRKLASANDTGQTLIEAIRTVAETSKGSLAKEFDIIYKKVEYGTSLQDALIEFNNKYHIPRLARTVTLVSRAQEASNQISDVLQTAARAAENQDDIDRERKSRTRMQLVIIIMTYVTLLTVMVILKTQFLDTMANLGGGGGGGGGGASLGGGIDVQRLSLLFFHAVTFQAIISGFIGGYIRDAKLLSGLKFVVILVTVALAAWTMVG